MGDRYRWLTGAASLAFASWFLLRVVRPTTEGTPWPLLVLVAALLGAATTGLVLTAGRGPIVATLTGVVGVTVTVLRIAGPAAAPLLPSAGTLRAALEELARAVALVRYGAAPVVPRPGLVALLAAAAWILTAVVVWGLGTRRPLLGLLPPLSVGVVLATIDRPATPLPAVAIFLVLAVATIVAADARRTRPPPPAAERGGRGGRTRIVGSLQALALLGTIVLAALLAVVLLDGRVPAGGTLPWRTHVGLAGNAVGGVAYNPFVAIQKGLVSRANTPVFTATIEGDVPPEGVSFRLLTLDAFDGGQWYAPTPHLVPLDGGPWEDPGEEYVGPTRRIRARVEIRALTMDWLPAPYRPVEVTAADPSVAVNLRVRTADAALRYDGGLSYPGLAYTVTADVPRLDLAAVVSTPDGSLSPLFAAAAAAGEATLPTPRRGPPRRDLPDQDHYLELPPDLDPRIARQALLLTRLLKTPFEKGLALEQWFRVSGGFTYDVAVTPGNDAATIASWLFDASPANRDYRRGYCEQFATAMAVMARTVGVPSRVVLGFTPGDRIGGNRVVVRERNAHAWVELWVPSQGWVRFDPTPRSDGANPVTSADLDARLGFGITAYLGQIVEPARAPIPDSAGAPPVIASADRPDRRFVASGGGDEAAPTDGLGTARMLAGLLLLAAFALALPLLTWARRRRRLRRARAGDVVAAWEEILVRLDDAGLAPDPALTPMEVARRADEERLLPLARIYSSVVYGPPGRVPAPVARETVEVSLRRAVEHLVARTPWPRRLLAWYRVSSPFRRRLAR